VLSKGKDQLADEGMPVKNIMSRLGHKTMAMANRYTHAVAETEVRVIRDLDEKWSVEDQQRNRPSVPA
jgi:integrase